MTSTASNATAASPSTSPSSSSGTITLDHIVILIPYAYLALPGLGGSQTTAPPPPDWFRDLFTFSPGGRHTDGVTENVLVLLRDGVYLEFIAFTPEAEKDGARLRREHRWGGFVEGSIVDWAVTVLHPGAGEAGSHADRQAESQAKHDYDDVVKPITQRVLQKSRCGNEDGGAPGLAVVYGDLTPGGRKRPDGVQLEWATVPAVAVPISADDHGGDGGGERRQQQQQQQTRPVQPGQAPFWCLDETPRGLRVPYRQGLGDGGGGNSQTEHANTGAVGVAKVQVTPAPGVATAQNLGRLFGEMFTSGDGEKEQARWALPAPEGTRFHQNGALDIQEAATTITTGTGDAAGGIAGNVAVSLYTDRPELAGKRVGGEVEGGREIWFELVGV